MCLNCLYNLYIWRYLERNYHQNDALVVSFLILFMYLPEQDIPVSLSNIHGHKDAEKMLTHTRTHLTNLQRRVWLL